VCCGTDCCGQGEWCDSSGIVAQCRCGTGSTCTGGNTCQSGGPVSVGGSSGADSCGRICCGASGSPCPISRREYKRDIQQLDAAELQQIYEQLRQIQLTTYQYKTDPLSTPRQLGFIIDDTKTPYPINSDGNSVNLYGYVSMAVAAIQVQSREIQGLRAEVARLKREHRR
jgi:hypothetical protein